MSTPLSAVAMAESFIFQRLAQDSQIQAAVGNPDLSVRIYSGHAPEGTETYPVVVFAYLAATDVVAIGGHITMTKLRYRVSAADLNTSLATLDPLAQRIGQLLHLASTTYSQGYVVACFRLFPTAAYDVDKGRELRDLGYVIEIQVTEANQTV